MRCLKAFEERIAANDPERQTAEIPIRIALMNRFNALGSAEIERVAYHQRDNGQSCPTRDACNTAVSLHRRRADGVAIPGGCWRVDWPGLPCHCDQFWVDRRPVRRGQFLIDGAPEG